MRASSGIVHSDRPPLSPSPSPSPPPPPGPTQAPHYRVYVIVQSGIKTLRSREASLVPFFVSFFSFSSVPFETCTGLFIYHVTLLIIIYRFFCRRLESRCSVEMSDVQGRWCFLVLLVTPTPQFVVELPIRFHFFSVSFEYLLHWPLHLYLPLLVPLQRALRARCRVVCVCRDVTSPVLAVCSSQA